MTLKGLKLGSDKPEARAIFYFVEASVLGSGVQVSDWAGLDLSGYSADFSRAKLRRINMTEAKLGGSNLKDATLALCTVDKADFSAVRNVETGTFRTPLGADTGSVATGNVGKFFNLEWSTATVDGASPAEIEDVAFRRFVVRRTQTEGMLPAGRRLEGAAVHMAAIPDSDKELQFHFTGSFQAIDPKDLVTWGPTQYTDWGVDDFNASTTWNGQTTIPISNIKLHVQRPDYQRVDRLEGILWLAESIKEGGIKYFFTVRVVEDPSKPGEGVQGSTTSAAPLTLEQYMKLGSGSDVPVVASAAATRKALRYSPGAKVTEHTGTGADVPLILAASCFDTPGDSGHADFQHVRLARSSKHGVGLLGLSRYGTSENDLILQGKAIGDLLDTFERMTTNSVTGDNWRTYCLVWATLRDMAQRTQNLDYNVGDDRQENEVMLDVVKLLVFPFERDLNQKSASVPGTKEGQDTAALIKSIAERVQDVWSGDSSASKWGSSPSDILDSIAVVAPGYTLGPPPPGVLQAIEDLERPLRGKIFVDIKTVRLTQPQRWTCVSDPVYHRALARHSPTLPGAQIPRCPIS